MFSSESNNSYNKLVPIPKLTSKKIPKSKKGITLVTLFLGPRAQKILNDYIVVIKLWLNYSVLCVLKLVILGF